MIWHARSIVCIAALAWAPAASAQSLNVDFGTAFGPPSDEYGAAADQPGVWNSLGGNDDAPQPLLDTRGDPSGVTVTPQLPSGPAFFDNPGTSGDDQSLMDDYLDLHSHPQTFTLSGLRAGAYTVYTYAWAPDDAAYYTFVDVNDKGGVPIGGEWPGHHQEGVTFARHTVQVGAGEDLVVYTFALLHGSLNGIQVVQAAGCPADLDRSGSLDLFDFLAFTNLFNAGDPAADCDSSGNFDLFDFLCFQNLFVIGCP